MEGNRLDKKQLRERGLAILQSFTNENRAEIEKKLVHYLTNTSWWTKAKTIGVTLSMGEEWNTDRIIEACRREGKRVCIPRCLPQSRKLEFYTYEDEAQLEIVYHHLREPIPNKTTFVAKNEIDLLIVPGILFDVDGYRLGFGGGYYDRYLVDFQQPTISLLHTKQLKQKLPVERFDIPVKHLITEHGVLI
ncbi:MULTISPECIES: 5-formyltetrahydrofolate cyclo-ligase [unclassified Virgibacillus]|uniref:5-formyltetrahydrofolate cyclo-ligase n=1 Tax=unclassified Virgibacillus TaxID=2620237 RepID=UPI0024DEDAF8|nr:5-formyltetrahydrofolate cyclo-ligase [Virgibacillus sp. LDC-1]